LNTHSFRGELGDEQVWIPYRIYRDPASMDWTCLSQTPSELLACLLTSHHNGFIRHANLTRILDWDCQWVPPFIVPLVGEYVIEIVRSTRGPRRLPESGLRSSVSDAKPSLF
jgi:hypothetical protein